MEMDVQKYRKIEKGIFAPVLSVIARQIVEKTASARSVHRYRLRRRFPRAALAEITDLFIHFYDENGG